MLDLNDYIPKLLLNKFNALYSYQKWSIHWITQCFLNRWLQKRGQLQFPDDQFKIQKGLILGHAPGLGHVRKTLIVVPKALLFQWKEHLLHWCGAVQLIMCDGTAKERKMQLRDAVTFRTFVLLTTYDLVCDESIAKLQVDVLVLDEATQIKNEETRAFQKLEAIDSTFRLVLTGTPLMNNLRELYNLVDFTNPGFLGSRRDFLAIYEVNIMKGKLDTSKRGLMKAYESELHRYLHHIMLRLSKSDIQMPVVKNELFVFVKQNSKQQLLYQKILQLPDQTGFSKLSFTRKLCDCYQRFTAEEKNTLEISDVSDQNEKEQLFQKMTEHFASEKLKTLVFSEYVQTLDHFQTLIQHPFLRIDGSTENSRRQSIIAQFKNTPINFLFLSIKTSAFGLNLQAASNIIIISPSWNPSIEEQAIARAFRVGQKQDVFCYRFITENSIEEKMVERQFLKTQLHGAIDMQKFDIQLNESMFDVFDTKCQLETKLKSLANNIKCLDDKMTSILINNFVFSYAEEEFAHKQSDNEDNEISESITSIQQLRIMNSKLPEISFKTEDLNSIFNFAQEQNQEEPKFEFSE